MTDEARTVPRTYLVLTLLTTLAASFIWGINTLFLRSVIPRRGGVQALALPFIWLARRERASSDPIVAGADSDPA